MPRVLICSPALADANNGNWQTASRWARMLEDDCDIRIATGWGGEPCDLLIALHARRSAPAVAAFRAAHPLRPCVVVLTGTDLYRDIAVDASAATSLQLADRLVVLQPQGLEMLDAGLQRKTAVIYQSASRLPAWALPAAGCGIDVISVAHLRDEKDPATLLRAAVRLASRHDIRITLIGDALDSALGHAVRDACRSAPSLRWLGGLPRPATRQHIQQSQLLVNTSRMEGGAHVILEAAQSGCAVAASRIPGNVGMLGADHEGLFELGDDAQLARLIERAADDRPFLVRLREQTVKRADLFEPAEEQRRLRALIGGLLETSR